jgi:hypothetical protein
MSDKAQFVSSLNLSRFVARLRVERDLTTRSLLHKLLIEEASNLAFNLGQLGSLQHEVIEGRARIAIQIAVVETLAANGQDARLAESMLCDLIEVQKTIERYRQVIVEAMDRNHDTHNAASMNHASKMAVAKKGGKNDQVDCCCWFCLSRRNIGASDDTRADSSAGWHDHASRCRLRAG